MFCLYADGHIEFNSDDQITFGHQLLSSLRIGSVRISSAAISTDNAKCLGSIERHVHDK